MKTTMDVQGRLPNRERLRELESLIFETNSKKFKDIRSAIGFGLIPFIPIGITAIFTHYTFKDQDLGNLVSFGSGIVIGASIGVWAYEKVKDKIREVRYSIDTLDCYRRELSQLN
jgi:hypothetical protein